MLKIKIKITKTPPGPAPEGVRKAWVGVEITTSGLDDTPPEQFSTGGENAGGYRVKGRDAVAALEAVGRFGAAAFWRPFSGDDLVFKKECCEPIE